MESNAPAPNLAAWLSALSTSPDYALAFAQAYEALDGAQRDAWLTELESENAAPSAYYPLLAVESAPSRVFRIRVRLSGAAAAANDVAHAPAPMVAYRDGAALYLLRSMYSAFIGPVRFIFGNDGTISAVDALPLGGRDSFRATLSASAKVVPIEEATVDVARGVMVNRRLGREIPALLLSHPELLDSQIASSSEGAP